MAYETEDKETYRGDVNQYNGAKNNRIDRFEDKGNRFRVSGVPNHIQDTTVYIKDDIMFLRTLRENVVDVYNAPADGFIPLDALSSIYRFPSFPNDLPDRPARGQYVPDPYFLSASAIGFERWPLNRTFEDVQWRAVNSTDSFKCNVVDTIEIQPWLCHSECTDALSRVNKVDYAEAVWYDNNTGKFLDDFAPPNVNVPLAHKWKLVVVRQASTIANGIITLGAVDVDDYRGITIGNFDVPYYTFTYNAGTLKYESDLPEIAPGANVTAFDAIDGFYTAAVYWDDNFATAAFTNAMSVRLGAIESTVIQADGYCYVGHDKDLVNENGSLVRLYCEPEHLADVWFPTEYLVYVPACRIPVGSENIDLNKPKTFSGEVIPGYEYEGIFNINPVRPGVHLSDGNNYIYMTHKNHFGPLGQSMHKRKFARVYYDADVDWFDSDYYNNQTLVPAFIPILSQPNETLTRWCVEFDMSDPMGAYLAHHWRSRILNGTVAGPEPPAIIAQGCMCKASAPQATKDLFHGEPFGEERIAAVDPKAMGIPEMYHGAGAADLPESIRTPENKLYMFSTENGFVHNLAWNAATTAWILNNAPGRTPTQINAFSAELADLVDNQNQHKVFFVTNLGHANGIGASGDQMASYPTMSFDCFSIQPSAVKPTIPIGLKYSFYEPFFVFNSGMNLFPAKRPYDRQPHTYPLVIQDYDIQFRRNVTSDILSKRPSDLPVSSTYYHADWYDNNNTLWNIISDYQGVYQSKPTLIVRSGDYGNQQEKDISVVHQYAPLVEINQTLSVRFDANEVTAKLFLDKGFPSFFFLRLDWQKVLTLVRRPSIQSVKITMFNQENTFVSKLTEDELYYLCLKNCHKYCKFHELWSKENALVLRLEDFGLMTEDVGYPHKKRLEINITVAWDVNTAIAEKLSVTKEEARVQVADYEIALRTMMIYENRQFVGDIRRNDFIETYL